MSTKKSVDEEPLEDFLASPAPRAADLVRDAEEADDEQDDDEQDEEHDLWTEEDLSYLSRGQLKGLADDWEVEFSVETATKALIKFILEAQQAGLECATREDQEAEDGGGIRKSIAAIEKA